MSRNAAPRNKARSGFVVMSVDQFHGMSESAWQATVNGFLKQTRLLWVHNPDSRMMQGVKGFPDISALDPVTGNRHVWELKVPGNKATKAQEAWLAGEALAGAQTGVYYPKDTAKIKQILTPYLKAGITWR